MEAGHFPPSEPDVVPRLSPGDRLAGRYVVGPLIGEGATGEVYEALDELSAQPIAVKTLHARSASHPVAAERFRREIQLGRLVRHRNVCRAFDLGLHLLPDGTELAFLTMELLRGISFAVYQRRRGRLTVEEALPLVTQLTGGLAAAHEVGVIYRDFKPGNVMVEPAPDASGGAPPRLVLTDFGLARRQGFVDEGLTHMGEALGTPLYMAPEQVASGVEPLTPATDIYALGIVIYELVTGDVPFRGNATTVMKLKHLKERPPSPRVFVPTLDARWESAIMRCLERVPARRFQTARELEAALGVG